MAVTEVSQRDPPELLRQLQSVAITGCTGSGISLADGGIHGGAQMTRTIGAAVGVLLVVLFMATVAAGKARSNPRPSQTPSVVSLP
jgi:hypothetical protein